MEELSRIADDAERASRVAGGILLNYFRNLKGIEYKGVGDVVTEADRASETYLREELGKLHPGIAFYGEEFGFGDQAADDVSVCWAVDPLDGTANFAVKVPIFCVSIGLLKDGEPVAGIVYDPTRDEMFRAVKGKGATRNGIPCRVTERDPFDPIAPALLSADIIRERPEFISRFGKGRGLGSAAIQLSYVADGIADVGMDFYTNLHDVAAGALLVEEAGGIVTHLDGTPLFPISGNPSEYNAKTFDYIASNGVNHAELVSLAKGTPKKPLRRPGN